MTMIFLWLRAGSRRSSGPSGFVKRTPTPAAPARAIMSVVARHSARSPASRHAPGVKRKRSLRITRVNESTRMRRSRHVAACMASTSAVPTRSPSNESVCTNT
jgi:hypothetical protein